MSDHPRQLHRVQAIMLWLATSLSCGFSAGVLVLWARSYSISDCIDSVAVSLPPEGGVDVRNGASFSSDGILCGQMFVDHRNFQPEARASPSRFTMYQSRRQLLPPVEILGSGSLANGFGFGLRTVHETIPGGAIHSYGVCVPHWFFLILGGPVTFLFWRRAVASTRRWVQERRRRGGLCPWCAYDLRSMRQVPGVRRGDSRRLRARRSCQP